MFNFWSTILYQYPVRILVNLFCHIYSYLYINSYRKWVAYFLYKYTLNTLWGYLDIGERCKMNNGFWWGRKILMHKEDMKYLIMVNIWLYLFGVWLSWMLQNQFEVGSRRISRVRWILLLSSNINIILYNQTGYLLSFQ